MMRNLSLLIALIFAHQSLAVAPYGLKGQQQTQTIYPNVHQAPNYQITNLGGINGLIETGNINLLANPGFEHSTYSTSWTLGGTGTHSAETSSLISGKKAAKCVASAQTCSFVQDSTLYASQLSNVQGETSVYVNSTAAGCKLCARTAGSTSATDCQDISSNGIWEAYSVAFILGATSNGISVACSSTTGTVIVEEAKVNVMPADRTPVVSGVGPWITWTPTGSWSTNSTYTGRYRQVGENIEFDIRIALAGAPTSASLTLNLPAGMVIDTTKLASSTNYTVFGQECLVQDNGVNSYDCTVGYNNTTSVALYAQAAGGTYVVSNNNVNATTPFTFGNTDAVSARFTLPIVGYGANRVYSQTCNTATTCENVFSATVTDGAGTTTVSNENLDFINGSCTNGSTGVYVCTFNSGIFSVAPNCVAVIDDVRIPRIATTSTTATITSYDAAGSVADGNSFKLVCQKQGVDFQQKNQITGSFAGYTKSYVSWAASDQTTTANTGTNVTGLSFALAANEKRAFEFHIQNGCNNTGGVTYALTVPSGATFRANARGSSTGVTAMTSSTMTVSGTLTGAFNTVNSAGGWTTITGVVTNGSTAGTVQLQFASGTSTQTSTVFAQSYVTSEALP